MHKYIRIAAILLVMAFAFASVFGQETEKQEKKRKKTKKTTIVRERSSDSTESEGERFGRDVERWVDNVLYDLGINKSRSSWNNTYYASYEDEDTTIVRRSSSDTTLQVATEGGATFEGNTVVREGDILRGNILVKGGTLTVLGKVEGDVMVIGGDLIVKNGGHITGNAKVVGGDIKREDGGVIEGYMDMSTSRTTSYRRPPREFSRSNPIKIPWFPQSESIENVWVRYNRVEGLFLGFAQDKKYHWDGHKRYSLYGSAGYGFKSHFWRGSVGISRQFRLGDDEMLDIGAEGYSLTDSKDRWLINVHENSLAAFLIHEDLRDYYQREGGTAYLAVLQRNENLSTELKVSYLVDTYNSLSMNTDWSLFGGDKKFRPNPSIDKGKMASIVASFGISTVRQHSDGINGWNGFVSAEIASPDLGGKFNFNQYLLDVRRYQPLSSSDNLNIRFRTGTSELTLPKQRVYQLGGVGTMIGFPYKAFEGNRMMLMNAELIIGQDFFEDADFWPLELLSAFTWVAMADAGWVNQVDASKSWTKGFNTVRFSDFKSDLGIGISTRSGGFRIGWAVRTDKSSNGVWFLRIMRPF